MEMFGWLLLGANLIGVQATIVMKYERLSVLDNYNCLDTDIVSSLSVTSVIECVRQCRRYHYDSCKSVFYLRTVGESTCYKCAEKYEVAEIQGNYSLPSLVGSVFYTFGMYCLKYQNISYCITCFV